MINTDYWLFKLYISIDNKDKLKTRLVAKGILRNIQSISTIKNVLFILAIKTFVNSIIKIILKSKFKAKIVFFYNNIFLFIYDIKTIIPS